MENPKVYDLNGNLIQGTWVDNFFNTQSNFNSDYVLVQHQKEVAGGNGVEDVINDILRVEVNGEIAPFISIDDKVKNVDFIINNEKKYSAYIDSSIAASFIIKYTIKSSDIVGRKITILNSLFNNKKIIGVVQCDQDIKTIKINSNGIEIEFSSDVNVNVNIDLSLDGHIIQYKPNSRTLVSKILVARVLEYVVTSNSQNFTILVTDKNKNVGVVQSIGEVKLTTGSASKASIVYVNGTLNAPLKVEFVEDNEDDNESINLSSISIEFENEILKDSIISIPVLMTYQPTEYDSVVVYYEYTPYQGVLEDMFLGKSDGFVKTLHRLTDWKLLSTNLGSSSLSDDDFYNVKRPKNTKLNTVDRLPGGLSISHEFLSFNDDKVIQFYDDLSTTQNPFPYASPNKYFRFHDAIVGSYGEVYENITIQQDKNIFIKKSNNKLMMFFDGLYGKSLMYAVKRYDCATCLVVDEYGQCYNLVVGVSGDSQSVHVEPLYFDLYKLDNAPLQISRKTNIIEFDPILNDTVKPTAPTGLAASNVGQTSVDLSWTASTDSIGIKKYIIYSNNSIIGQVGPIVTQYNVKNLSPGKTYTFTVRAVDLSENVSDASNEAKITTLSNNNQDNEAPTVPTGLATSNVGQTSVDLSWTASTDNVAVTGYEVLRDGTKIADVTVTTYKATGLTASTTYSFAVRAKDVAGNFSDATTAIDVTTQAPPDTQAPTAPTGLASSNVGQTSVDLSWTASTDNVAVTGYEVLRDGTKIADVTGTTYSATGLTASTTYKFDVRAKDAAGNFSNIATLNVTTATPPPSDTEAPTAPTNVVASTITATSLTLSWNASTDNVAVTGYEVYRGNKLVGTTTTTTRTFNVTGLSPGIIYYFTVKAKDFAGNLSNSSLVLEVRTALATPVLTKSSPTQTSFLLNWEPITSAEYYAIYNGATLIATTSVDQYQISGLTPNVTYLFSVEAVSNTGYPKSTKATISVTLSVMGTFI